MAYRGRLQFGPQYHRCAPRWAERWGRALSAVGRSPKAGSRVRINAQLIETETGALLWADRYDGALDDVFTLQDQVTDQVVGIVEPSLQRSEIERSRRRRALEASMPTTSIFGRYPMWRLRCLTKPRSRRTC